MTMNDLGNVCPVCGGAMRLSEYSHICAQEFGPCGMFYYRRTGKGYRGGTTKFQHTTFHRKSKKLMTTKHKHFTHVRFYGRGIEMSEHGYLARAGKGPEKETPPWLRAVVVAGGQA